MVFASPQASGTSDHFYRNSLMPPMKYLAALTASISVTLAMVCGLFADASYWLIAASIAFAFATQALLLQIFMNRLWSMQSSIDGISGSIVRNLPSELHAMQIILRRFPECSIPTTSWSMRFSNLLTILDLLDTHQPELVVEFGSGMSTLLVAAWMKENSHGKVVSFDHDRNWANVTRRHLIRESLAGYSEVIDAPLTNVASLGQEGEWYDISNHVESISQVDLLIVDGPPAGASEKRLSRLPALDKLYRTLSSSCIVVLDDANRLGEKEVVLRWTEAFSEFSAMTLQSETGLAVLTRTAHLSQQDSRCETIVH